MASSGPSVEEILVVLWEMEADERAQVRAALALEPVGGGSQPMSAITRATPSEKVWIYTEDWQERMLEQDWIERLNVAEASETHEVTFEFQNQWKHGCAVNLEAMVFKNHRSKKEGKLYRMEMIVLDVKDMLAKRSSADIDELQQGNAWHLRWQHTDPSGWKNMTPDSHKTLLSELVALKDVTVLTHDWLGSNSGTWNQTIYDVDFNAGKQTSRDYGHNQRDVRLVAMRDWTLRHN